MTQPNVHTASRSSIRSWYDYYRYDYGLWAGERGRTGFYAQNLTDILNRFFDSPTLDMSPAVTQAAFPLYTMAFSTAATPALDEHALPTLFDIATKP